jgi:DNA sulfur modification protein DndD
VILDELVLHNVGVFSGHHRLQLTPPHSSKPVVLFGGLNGAGKTTIRDALYLALYGPLAQGSTRRTGSYEHYLRSLISRGQPAHDGAAIELAFHAYREGASHAYRVRRSWRATASGAREQLTVLRDGRPDPALTATWTEQVEAFLPRGIAGLFFFDGEQIESMADLERSREVLGSALAALLGLDMVDRLDTDLAVIRRRHRTSAMPDELRQRVAEAQAVVTAARQAEESQVLTVATARDDVERATKQHFANTERYRAAGGELLEERELSEQRLTELRRDLGRLDEDLRELAAGAAPLLLVRAQLSALAARARQETAATRDRLLLDVLCERDNQILDQLRAAKVRVATIDDLEAFLEAERQQRQKNAGAEVVSGLAAPEGPDYLTERILPDAQRQLEQLLQRRGDTVALVEDAERLLAAIPDAEALLPLRTDRDAAHSDLLRTQAALYHAEDQLSAIRTDRDRADRVYEKLLDETTNAGLTIDDNRRLVEHLDKVRSTLEVFKVAATRRHIDRISALVLESLRRLMRKDNLITEVRIDPESFAVELRGSDGSVLAAEALSAGERQLLAVALLWGLAQASGQPLPVVIDTPLGRLDGDHRQRLLEHYFPQVSHQVVLLSTDTEIDAEAYDRLRRYIGHDYYLEFNPATSSTTVLPGYFWEQ